MIYSIILSITLAFDAFAVAVSLGLSSTVTSKKDKFKVAFAFGFFQFIMPVIGGFIISPFVDKYGFVVSIIGTVFLAFLGGKMIVESLKPQPNLCNNNMNCEACAEGVCLRTGKSKSLKNSELLRYSIATSIDALLAGTIINALELQFTLTVVLIGVITFAFSFIGVNFSKFVKASMEKKMEFAGGVILVLLAIKSIM